MKRALAALSATFLTLPSFAAAQITTNDTGLTQTGTGVYGSSAASLGTFLGSNIINPLFAISGVVFLILMVYAGFLWMTAAGNDERVAQAKRILTGTVIGLVIMVAAYSLVRFILVQIGA